LEEGLAPIGGGLILAGVVSLLRIGGGGPASWAVAVGSAGMLWWLPRLHPLLMFALGATLLIAVRAAGL
jgi:chromate transporter